LNQIASESFRIKVTRPTLFAAIVNTAIKALNFQKILVMRIMGARPRMHRCRRTRKEGMEKRLGDQAIA
jgi:hypothetical protein